jgi:hypothetical protein
MGIILSLSSCTPEKVDSYSFFVAGHTYGSPVANNPGLHPPFIAEFDKLNEDNRLDFGVLTGDIVRKASESAWNTVDGQLSQLSMKVYFCAGNHDTYDRELYEERYGQTYYTFQYQHDLFIVLDGSLDRWNIRGDQLKFLQETLSGADPSVKNTFVFIHQLVWWDEHNVFADVKLNWPPYTPDTTNYWSAVEPLLQDFHSPVYIFAGDIGASHKTSPVMYHEDSNITYIASGMGSIEMDNYIIVNVSGTGQVSLELVAMGDDPGKLGKLEDHLLSASP